MNASVLASVLVAAISTTHTVAALDVPLTISDIAGAERRQDVCSTGVPLPCGLLKDPKDIAVYDPSGRPVPAQFRVLERWREKADGRDNLSVKWLLVTFLADVPRGGSSVYHLKEGTNPSPASPVVLQDAGNSWRMGGMLFKKDFTSPFRLLFTDANDKTFSASDLPVTWTVWEAGPVRGCLKAESPTVPGKFGFIAWVYSYAGQKRYDMTVVLKNTPAKMRGPLYFKDFSVVWDVAEAKGTQEFILGGAEARAVGGPLEDGRAYVYQDSDGSDDWDKLVSRPKGEPWYAGFTLAYHKNAALGRPQFRGYKVMAGEKELASGNFAMGYAALNGETASAQVCVRNFLRMQPKATEIEPGRITVRLWPKYWKAFGGLHWLDDCQRVAHDVSFRLACDKITPAEAEVAAKAFNTPLAAHCGLDWYRKTGIYSYISPRFKEMPVRSADFQGPFYCNWLTCGGEVSDRIRRRYHEFRMGPFIRSGDPAQAQRLFLTMRHSSGLTPFWVDDYQFPRDNGVINPGYCSPPRDPGVYRSPTEHHGFMAWNQQHFMCAELFDGWRLFGDPLALDSLTKVGAFVQSYVEGRKTKGIGETRQDALPMTDLVEAYRITGNAAFLSSAKDFRQIMWKTINIGRGYYVPNKSLNPPAGSDKPFMLSTLMDGLRNYYEVTGDTTAVDMILGMTDYCIAEAWVNDNQGFFYEPCIDPKVRDKQIAQRKLNTNRGDFRAWQMSRQLAWCYLHTGEPRYQETFDALVRGADGATVLKRGWLQNPENEDWGYLCDRLYDQKSSAAAPPEPVKDLRVQPLGEGKVRLTWTAPLGGAARYQVKCSEKPMVERISDAGNKDGKSNWWSANNVGGEPKPAPAGTRETMIVEGIGAGRYFFAIRSFGVTSSRSPISNMAAIVIH